MSSKISMINQLLHLSELVNSCYLIEEVLSENLYLAIEQLIRNDQNKRYPDVRWHTVRWDVCANFEYKEIWFSPILGSNIQTNHQHLNIDECYAFFKLTIQNHDKKEVYLDDYFANNGNRLPTVNFFNHTNGFVCIQFHLNKNMIYKNDQQTCISKARSWKKKRNELIQQYGELTTFGFKLNESEGYWYLIIETLDPVQVATDFENKEFIGSLDPVKDAFKKIYQALDIFDLIEKKAKLLI
ncbi:MULTISPECIES: hypothetical protein [unclassified Acinetobacter]|uniref:hypothetical protein n=1 Tax=unclassified Acinetobacter TaxID=196816 RepID=UPI0015D1E063|nr:MULTISPECIES: hypothetical protein [unclassified Acinetobacter]UUS58468.1 hypothetical protein MST16_04600 [Acinetobacter sp. YH16040_T]